MGRIQGACLVPGASAGHVLFADVGLSFMGGVNPVNGTVIDVHHHRFRWPVHERYLLVLYRRAGGASRSTQHPDELWEIRPLWPGRSGPRVPFRKSREVRAGSLPRLCRDHTASVAIRDLVGLNLSSPLDGAKQETP